MSKETLKLYDKVEDKVIQYISLYTETAYKTWCKGRDKDWCGTKGRRGQNNIINGRYGTYNIYL